MSTKPRGIAARAGRWSAQHRKIAIFGWLAFVIAAFVIGNNLGTKKVEQTLPGESGRAQKIQEDNFPHAKKTAAEETILIQSKSLKASDPQYKAVVEDVEQQIGAEAHVRKVQSPYAEPGNPVETYIQTQIAQTVTAMVSANLKSRVTQ